MRSQTATAAATSRKRTREVRRSHGKAPHAVRYRDDDLDHVDIEPTSDEEMHSDDDDNDSLHGRPPSKQFKSSSRSRSRSPAATNRNRSAANVKSVPIGRSHQDDAAHLAATIRRQQMKDAFQPWVMQTYGDAAKTKTISRRKSERIARILRGEDRSNGADSSKFRFWVRAKGFRLGAPPSSDLPGAVPVSDADDLYVVTSTVKDEATGEDRPVYKKVAVVEDFFDIIYREHVEFMINGQQQQQPSSASTTQSSPAARPPAGKHAGQKRTYRAITEIYAFLPREAVTRFLMQCAECQRRGGNGTNQIPVGSVATSPPPPSTQTQLSPATQLAPSGVSPGSPTPPASPANAPATSTTTTTTTSAKSAAAAATGAKPSHLPLLLPPTPPQQHHHYQQSSTPAPIPLAFDLTSNSVDLSLPLTSTLLKRAALAGVSHQQLLGLDRAESSFCSTDAASSPSRPGMTAGCQTDDDSATSKRSTNNSPFSHASPNYYVMTSSAGSGLQAANGVASEPTGPITLDLSAKADASMDEHSPGAIKDDDDEDDDDVEDRIDTQGYDPERLKAFNMFVRLFVDENLDRMVPISRQPREKVQAIIDSCVRQFPEFGERARKRIRTYLKSCRRHKRPRDSSGNVPDAPATASGLLLAGSSASNRPMPPHLTSAAAEQILAQACENENQNAKRLRLGLEPISQPMPTNASEPRTGEQQGVSSISGNQFSPVSVQTETQQVPTTSSSTANLFRPAFGPYQRTTNPTPSPVHTGPTDLSTKSRSSTINSNGVSSYNTTNSTISRTSPIPHKLTPAEILAVRQLVTGYRESAAFLLRSADELEQLLQQQHASL